MGKYYDIVEQEDQTAIITSEELSPPEPREPKRSSRTTGELVPLPVINQNLGTLAQGEAIRDLSERLAPLAVIDSSVRLLISGCRPGDGASTLAAALALDLSQRLRLRTALVDAHLRHPVLHRLFPQSADAIVPLELNGLLQVRPTGWPSLQLINCTWMAEENEKQLIEELETVLSGFSAVVVDLGVVRLDPRMMAMARPSDPILLVVRYGRTRRQELATTSAALRAAGRNVAGVVLNSCGQTI